MIQTTEDLIRKVKAELEALDNYPVEIDGKKLKPSQCYHVNFNPNHMMFNTNCPDALKQQVEAIFTKYIPHETGAQ